MFWIHFSLISVICFLYLFLLFVIVFLLHLLIPILKKKSRVRSCQVITVINLNMRIPLRNSFLFLLLQLIKLGISSHLLLIFLFQLLFYNLIFLSFSLLYIFLIFILIIIWPNNCLPKIYNRLWNFNWNFAIYLLQIN